MAAPGYNLPDVALFKYDEWYTLESNSWLLRKYHYDYFDRTRDTRLGYHLHVVHAGEADTPHAHCGPGHERTPAHYRAFEVSLLEANSQFMRLYAAGEEYDCATLLPLEPLA